MRLSVELFLFFYQQETTNALVTSEKKIPQPKSFRLHQSGVNALAYHHLCNMNNATVSSSEGHSGADNIRQGQAELVISIIVASGGDDCAIVLSHLRMVTTNAGEFDIDVDVLTHIASAHCSQVAG